MRLVNIAIGFETFVNDPSALSQHVHGSVFYFLHLTEIIYLPGCYNVKDFHLSLNRSIRICIIPLR